MNVAEANSRSVIVEVPASRKLIEESPVTPPVATATMAPFATNLNDVFISVKTTKHYHHSRLPAIIDTWFQFAKNQVRESRLLDPCNVRYLGLISVARSLRFLCLTGTPDLPYDGLVSVENIFESRERLLFWNIHKIPYYNLLELYMY